MVEQGTHKPLVGSSTLPPGTNPQHHQRPTATLLSQRTPQGPAQSYSSSSSSSSSIWRWARSGDRDVRSCGTDEATVGTSTLSFCRTSREMEERMSRSSSLAIIAVDLDLICRLRAVLCPSVLFRGRGRRRGRGRGVVTRDVRSCGTDEATVGTSTVSFCRTSREMEERMSRSSSLPIIAVDFGLISRLRAALCPSVLFRGRGRRRGRGRLGRRPVLPRICGDR